MTVHAFTSFTFSYLNRARVLASSLRSHHPDWTIWAFVTDKAPEDFDFDIEREDFDKVVFVEELFGDEANGWLFKHDIVEACTAVKGRALKLVLDQADCEQAFYFDPDIAVFNSMFGFVEALRSHSIVLTPHQIDPEPLDDTKAILDNEVASLSYGIFNLGFIAVANDNEGRRFAEWWENRLRDWCHDRLDIGLFVDQKWCNLVPCFFDNVLISRDPGYNVASWNLSQRKISFNEQGTAVINSHPLRFFHFTKLGPIGDIMTQRYARNNMEVYEIWWWYRNAVRAATDLRIPEGWWHYGLFDNGNKIPKDARILYRDRIDLQAAFPAPASTGPNSFIEWIFRNTDIEI